MIEQSIEFSCFIYYINAFFFSFFLSGGYDKEEKAARAYDLAALKYWGPTTTTNFPVSGSDSDLFFIKQKRFHVLEEWCNCILLCRSLTMRKSWRI